MIIMIKKQNSAVLIDAFHVLGRMHIWFQLSKILWSILDFGCSVVGALWLLTLQVYYGHCLWAVELIHWCVTQRLFTNCWLHMLHVLHYCATNMFANQMWSRSRTEQCFHIENPLTRSRNLEYRTRFPSIITAASPTSWFKVPVRSQVSTGTMGSQVML
jgi:hypothetical protein